MNAIVRKMLIVSSFVTLLLLNSSCVDEYYVDCDNAKIELVNNTGSYLYFSADGDYCYPNDYLYPGESVLIPYGEIHSSSSNPIVFPIYYRFGSAGYADVRNDVEMLHCVQVVNVY